MATTADIRKGFTFMLEGKLYLVVDFLHVKPGKGGAFVRTKLKNLENNYVTEMTFKSGEVLNEIRLEKNSYEFLYKTGDELVFMNLENYEQISLDIEIIGDRQYYLKENMEVVLSSVNERIIDIELPFFVNLEIVETDPGLRGNTVSGGSKSAICDTGLKITVPLFINTGDKIKVDTRTGNYVERV